VSSNSLATVCAWCGRVRNGSGRWEEPDAHPVSSDTTHGICPDCLAAQTREATALAACS
jgi:hypothetical protein